MSEVVLHHGDCLDILRALPDASVDAIVTDPPYKLSQTYSTAVDADNLLAVSSIWGAAHQLLRVSKSGGVCAVFYDTRILPIALRAMADAGWVYLRGLTFYRRWGQASMFNGWMSTSDFVLLFAKPGKRPKFYADAAHDVYIKKGPEAENTGHPAQKPIDALEHIVRRITPPGGVVLDPYMGSGSTGVAAVGQGFQFIGIEKEAEWVDMARKRINGAKPRTRQIELFSA